MGFLNNLERSNVAEHISLTTNAATAKNGSFSTLTEDTIVDVVIQNLSAAACYITFGTTTVTATSNDMYLAANASVSLNNTKFVYFSVIRATGTDVTLRITGIGKS